MSHSNGNSIDRALRYAPWVAGVLVVLCVIALVVRVAIRATKTADRQEHAIAYQPSVAADRATDTTSADRKGPDSAARPSRARPAETVNGAATDNTSPQGDIERRGVIKEPESPRSKSRLQIHSGGVSANKTVTDSGVRSELNSDRVANGNASSEGQRPKPETIAELNGAGKSPLAGLSLDASGRTSFFGIEANGQRFVYVLDRSSSMGVPQNKPMRAAKEELLASLSRLDSVNQFFLIFYNQRPVVFNPTGVSSRLVFATDLNKQSAQSFIDAIPAEGGTNHYAALRLAVGLHPDVIFLLTDGEPKDDLSSEELADLKRLNVAASRIYVIQFASSSYSGNSLARLAEENRGEHKYVDIRRRSNEP